MQHKNIYILMQLTYQFQGQKVRVTRPIIAGHKSKTNKMWYQMGMGIPCRLNLAATLFVLQKLNAIWFVDVLHSCILTQNCIVFSRMH